MKKQQIVNTDKMEINKPSELTQIVFTKGDDCNAVTTLTATQLDMLNLIFYKSKEHYLKEQKEIGEFVPFEIDLNVFPKELCKYDNYYYDNIIKQLIALYDVKVVINALNKNKNMVDTVITRFIHKITVSRHQNDHKKKVRLVLDGEICNMIFNVKRLFTKFFLKIQFSMISKYSKLLYEVLKDYQNINTKVIEFETLLNILNVDPTNLTNRKWAFFNRDVLKKAVDEINTKSDIRVEYETIKERIDSRLQVSKVKFTIESQPDSRLKELGLLDPDEDDITFSPYYDKSRSKLTKMIKDGYKVIDELMWIKTDIGKNSDRYEIEMRIDTWLDETSKEDKAIIYETVAANIPECDDPIVVIDEYIIKGVFSRNAFTRTPQETVKYLNSAIKSSE